MIRRVISKLFFPLPVTTALAIYHSIKYIREGLSALLHGKLSVAVLDATAVTVSMVRGDFSTASSVMFMLRLGEILEDWTHQKSVADLAGAMSLNVDHVWLKTGETETLVPIGDIQAGDCVVVRTGSLIPLDGKVVSGEAMVNQASMTGESMPVPKREGSYVYAGTVAEEGECVVRVEKALGGGRYDRIVRMIEESEKLKSKGILATDLTDLTNKARYISFGGRQQRLPLVVSNKGYGIATASSRTALFCNIKMYGQYIFVERGCADRE